MDLSVALLAGSHLTESQGTPHSSLKSSLLARLKRYYECIQTEPSVNELSSLEQVQLQTAEEALNTIEHTSSILEATDSSIPLIGTRDIALLHTLLSITLRWAIEPCLSRVVVSCADENTVDDQDYIFLNNHSHRFFRLVFPSGAQGPIAQSHIAISIIDKYAVDTLKLSITLGWMPKSLVSSASASDEFSTLTARFLALLTPSQGVVALSTVMSSKPSAFHIRRACAMLLSSQLMRPNGILGLCVAVFGEDSSEDSTDLVRLENVARVLINVPSGMTAESYFADTIPRMTAILCDSKSLPAYKRAMGFALSRMLAADKPFLHHASASKILLSQLHKPLSEVNETDANTALSILTNLIMNADPSPTLISTLLSPVIPSVYALSFYLDSVKTSDPLLKELVRSILTTWGRVVALPEGVDCLWHIIRGEKSNWQKGSDGLVKRVESMQKEVPLAMFTPESLKRAEEVGELDSDSNILGLYPDPVHFVQFLQSLGQSELFSDLLVKLLEAYRDQKEQDGDDDPSRTLHFLQLILQMQTRLQALNILNKPEHILMFIHHALETPIKTPTSNDVNGAEDSDADSDDDTPNSVMYTADNEVIETSVNLLLSVLEANQNLSARTAPILNTIFSLLEPFAFESNPGVRSIAREARMVMTARLASTSASSTSANIDEDDTQQTYQKALKLLQDPILPVRAHGLLLLRQLVAPSMKARLDSALVPAITSIFLQSVQDEDSYMYLNAIQGLATLVDTYGKEILKSLVRDYVHGLERDHLTEQEVDTRLRIGEALGMIVRRCGNTLAAYASILVPPLLHIVQSGHVATTLRTSAISLLAECESVCAPALLPFLVDLWEGMVDLLQVESHGQQVGGVSEDSDPAIANAKLPSLRRAAIHLLSQLIRGATKEVYESPQRKFTLISSSIERARITLKYVAGTDGDTLVRVMAQETAGLIHDLERAAVGI